MNHTPGRLATLSFYWPMLARAFGKSFSRELDFLWQVHMTQPPKYSGWLPGLMHYVIRPEFMSEI